MGKSGLPALGFCTEVEEDHRPYGDDSYAVLRCEASGNGAEQPRVLRVLSALLERVVNRNDALASTYSSYASTKLTVFHGLRAPTISIDKYLERIFRYANCSPACFVVAYVYIDRIVQQHPELLITSLNVHRLLITSVMLAAKFQDDAYFNNAYYAKVGGVMKAEMNRLEIEFLFRLDFRLHVTPAMFGNYCMLLEEELLLLEAPITASLAMFDVDVEKSHAGAAETLQHQSSCSDVDPGSRAMSVDESYEVQTPPRDIEPYCRPGRSESASPMAQ